jgi:hypothetical protein
MAKQLSKDELQQVQRAYARISERGWGIAYGVLGALGLFAATAILLLKGGSNPGPRLSLLGQYFPGYRVTWTGTLIGACYGFVVGYVVGRVIGTIYNRIVDRA